MIDRHFIVGLVTVLLMIVLMFTAHAHDMTHPEFNEWYSELMQPDNPTMSCCGKADSYFADEMRFHDGKAYAVISDDRPDEPLKRPHIPNGTEIEVPNNKLKYNRGNPTGHGVLFVSPAPYNFVYCYVQAGGA